MTATLSGSPLASWTALLSLRQGDEARARELYAEISTDVSAPSAMRARVQEMLKTLGGAEAGTVGAGAGAGE